MSRQTLTTKSTSKSSTLSLPSLPLTIFSLPLTSYNIPLTKHILSIFYQQSTFKKRESRTSLLQKLARIEATRTDNERETVSQLLRHDITITRAAIKAGPQDEDEDGQLLEKGKDTECEVCLEALPARSFRHQMVESKCEHETHICTPCLDQAVIANIANDRAVMTTTSALFKFATYRAFAGV
ncbi:hypothetical protein SBOR_4394 [Sclerotinia borealis F-4128]|uniref:RING-type domain-containing protein n=1 Tax=Sclerotinia borealis (strain F-4128) TaxID=1432307 RepID=W9CL19_SCLBF|nr:hypothetical protein SBOR_4394 [Sclerotinia borealis F-4128]